MFEPKHKYDGVARLVGMWMLSMIEDVLECVVWVRTCAGVGFVHGRCLVENLVVVRLLWGGLSAAG